MADADTGETGEEIELEEFEVANREEDLEEVEETNLDDDEGAGDLEWDDSTLAPQGFKPDLGSVPDVPRGFRRILTLDRKKFLKTALSVSLNKNDGPNLRIIFENLKLTNDRRSGKNNGALYGDGEDKVKIIVMKDGRYEYSKEASKKMTRTIAEFKATLEKAKAEHEKTAIGDTEKRFEELASLSVEDVSQDDVVSILKQRRGTVEQQTLGARR